MRVGSLLNSLELFPLILHDLYESDLRAYSKVYWLAEHSPNFALRWVLQLFKIRYQDPKLNLQKLFATCLNFESLVQETIVAGSTHLEISADLIFLTQKTRQWFKQFLPYLVGLKKQGITYSVHLPQFGGMFLETNLEIVRPATILELEEIVKFFKDLDPLFVLHLGGGERIFHYLGTHGDNPVVEQELDRTFGGHLWPWRVIEKKIARFVIGDAMATSEQFLVNKIIIENLQESLAKIARFLPLHRLCLENLEHGPFSPVVKSLIKTIPISVCLDVGHKTIEEWQDNKKCFEDFMRDFGHRLAIMHIHQVVEIGHETYGNETRVVLQDHKPLDVRGGIVPIDKILRLAQDVGNRTGRDETPLVLELYYHNPIPSIRILTRALKQLA